MRTSAPGLADMSLTQLVDELDKRRAAHARALSALLARGDREVFDASLNSFHRDVDAIRGETLKVTMYVAVVIDRDGGYACRGVYPTPEKAQARLQTEVRTKVIAWQDYGGGFLTSDRIGELKYEVEPVKVHAS